MLYHKDIKIPGDTPPKFEIYPEFRADLVMCTYKPEQRRSTSISRAKRADPDTESIANKIIYRQERDSCVKASEKIMDPKKIDERQKN